MLPLRLAGWTLLLALLWGGWWWQGGVPVEVTVRSRTWEQAKPVPPSVAESGVDASTPTLLLTVTRACPGIDGLAVGDAVRFDRYGLLAPQVGSQLPVPAGVDPTALQFVPYGGGCSHAGEIRVTRPAAAAAGAHEPGATR